MKNDDMVNSQDWDAEQLELVDQELNDLLEVWGERCADPKVVCTTTLIRMSCLAGQFYAGDEDSLKGYLETCMKAGVDQYNLIAQEYKKHVH